MLLIIGYVTFALVQSIVFCRMINMDSVGVAILFAILAPLVSALIVIAAVGEAIRFLLTYKKSR